MLVLPPDVFLSYKSEDRPRLEPLVAALQAEGFSVWWDAHISGGANWRQDIQDHLDAAKCVIVAWTTLSVGQGGEFVRDEATRARQRGAYLPICLDGVRPPLGFGEIQALSLNGWNGNRSDVRYRAVVDAVKNCISRQGIVPVQTHSAGPRISRRAVVAGGVGVGAIAAAGTGAWLLLKPAAANAKRIAVLPFANMSSDREQAYFTEGVAEELRAALSRVGLEVIARTSSDAVKNLESKAAAAKLGVANILTGSVRRSAKTIRVNAQLISGSDGVERWAQSYDRAPGDVIKIQSDIAGNVAQALSIVLGQAGRAALALGGTADNEAHELVLKGLEVARSANGETSAREAAALFTAAITRDPQYADAHVHRAGMLEVIGALYSKTPAQVASSLAQAEAGARRAIAIAPRLGFAHATLGSISLGRFNFTSSLRHVRRSLDVSPDDPRVIRRAAGVIPFLGQRPEALRLSDRALLLDPLSAHSFSTRCQVLLSLGRYQLAIDAARKALELAPENPGPHLSIGVALTMLNQPDQARAEYKWLPADHPLRLTGEAVLAARVADSAEMDRIIAKLRSTFGVAASFQYAQIYSQRGDANRAFAELEKAAQAKDTGLVGLKVDSFLEPIRRDARYEALVRRLKFP